MENIDIPIENIDYPNLIITGKNGSGKTVLLNAISDFFNYVKKQKNLHFLSFSDSLNYWKEYLKNAKNQKEQMQAKEQIETYQNWIKSLYGKVDIQFVDIASIIEKYEKEDFIISFYQADRKVRMVEPKNPTKPVYNKKGDVKEIATAQFLNFLSDLKIQEALARNEKQIKDADEINAWFIDLENLLKQIFQDDNLKLIFNYKDYSFIICSGEKKFKFTEVSDGFAAVLDIVADLILKMQESNTLTNKYMKEGIVLIDEIETHLHLGLQKIIMPLLTRIFPNIQFIITTHSPFVLSSVPNAVAYDLEHKKPIEDLTNYSYESLAEGYFGVRAESSDVRHRLNKMKELLVKEELTPSEKESLRIYIKDFDSIPEAVSPSFIGEYLQLKLKYVDKIKELMQ